MIKGTSLSAKLYLGFGIILVIVASLGAFTYSRLLQIETSAKIITTDCMPGVYTISAMSGLLKDNLRFVLTAVYDEPSIGSMQEAIKDNVSKMDKMTQDYEATITQPKDRELFNNIKTTRDEFRPIRNSVMAALVAKKRTEAEALYKSQLIPAELKYQDAINAEVDFNKSNSDVSATEIMNNTSYSKLSIILGVLGALLFGSGIGIFLSRSISSALQKVIASLSEGSEQVSSASSQVSQSSQQMAEGASEQASSLEETSASLEEMSSMTKQNSDNAKQANVMANDTREAVEKSRTAMSRMSEAIGQIKNSSDQTAKIVKTIDEIAFQTNLLALNAAVEAARAGDAGKGFAVVAEEVRNLAQRSAEAAKNTSSLIEQSQKNADNGVAVSQEVAGILTQIVDSVHKLSQLIGEVSSASMEQAKGIEQIGTAVTEMDKLTQSNAANAEESASASEELSAQANELNDMVEVLVGIVTGSSNTAGRPMRQQPVAARKAHHTEPHNMPERKLAKFAPPKARAKQDWSTVAPKGNSKNGHTMAMAKTSHPEEVIPLNEDELKDF